jgi:curved DNA-binding protein CbpA
MFKDYYQILDIDPDSTTEEIRKAYKAASMKYHPDRNPGKDTTSQMQDINEAYAILKDDDKRSRYDQEYKRFKQETTKVSEPKTTSWTYSTYDIKDENVKRDVDDAREYARSLVEEFMQSLKRNTKVAVQAAGEELKSWVVVLIIMTILGLLFAKACVK